MPGLKMKETPVTDMVTRLETSAHGSSKVDLQGDLIQESSTRGRMKGSPNRNP